MNTQHPIRKSSGNQEYARFDLDKVMMIDLRKKYLKQIVAGLGTCGRAPWYAYPEPLVLPLFDKAENPVCPRCSMSDRKVCSDVTEIYGDFGVGEQEAYFLKVYVCNCCQKRFAHVTEPAELWSDDPEDYIFVELNSDGLCLEMRRHLAQVVGRPPSPN